MVARRHRRCLPAPPRAKSAMGFRDTPPPVLAEQPPRLAGVKVIGMRADSQRGQADTEGVQNSRDVVIGAHQQSCRIFEGLVSNEQSRIHVAVRREDQAISNSCVQFARDGPSAGLRGEEAIGVKFKS